MIEVVKPYGLKREDITGADTKTTPVDADSLVGVDSADGNSLKRFSWANIKATLKTYFDTLYQTKTAPQYITVALSGDGQPIAAGLSKGSCRIPIDSTITGVTIDCDPADEPAAISVQVDCNVVDRTTGARTSVLSSVASIAASENTGTGAIKTDGTEDVLAGTLVIFDVDQGSDGGLLTATIEITPA